LSETVERHTVDFGRDVCGVFDVANGREWLVTNGIGGYASGTLDGSLTRAYHGLLVAALAPPGARTLLAVKFDETCTYLGTTYDLATNRWASGAIDPHGYRNVERFYLAGTTPVWNFAFAGALIEKSITMVLGENVTVVRYRVLRALGPVRFSLRAIVDGRDHNGITRAGDLPLIASREGTVVVTYPSSGVAVVLRTDRGTTATAGEWFRDFDLIRERERGLPDREDHVHAADIVFSLVAGEEAHVSAATPDVGDVDPARAFADRATYESELLATAPRGGREIAHLALAADQFVVERRAIEVPDGKTVIAGYPWFTDWGRDTAISLPGLAIVTGRRGMARSILETFGRYVDGGMLPNVFPDRGDLPEYNTVDAALWYVDAVRAYVAAFGIDAAFDALYEACASIVDGYRGGTRYGIHMDPADGLIAAGEPGVALTWMDAKVGDWVVTPRIGKPVEINALWYNALRTLADLSRRRGIPGVVYDELAKRVLTSFARFQLHDGRGLADVLDGPGGTDASLRPNQIFAVALEHSPLERGAAREVVDICTRELVTSHGLRTLARSDPHYVPTYAGPRGARDAAYHQGTVWPWLLGPFATAYARAYDDPATALTFLEPLLSSIRSYGLGTIAEIADAETPFAWKGAIAQAWSVAELLRALSELVADVRAGGK
jgi:predicted glycogen debranching enzyme